MLKKFSDEGMREQPSSHAEASFTCKIASTVGAEHR